MSESVLFLFIYFLEKAKQSTGGVAYDVILKPASSDLTIKSGSPPKEQRAITQEAIADKLKKAQERREVIFCLSLSMHLNATI